MGYNIICVLVFHKFDHSAVNIKKYSKFYNELLDGHIRHGLKTEWP
jgi:hypothetical protein